ncbi:MAG: hypothetical protein KZQ88_18500 [Candidatus Thiodiazotropha sp. (ex Dulcina madagascariensis)]|nr:hypothetical protein [Candidatus Thiodiazotropha sp. (ex Dulcina madagascariensis)]MCU7925107.1 hypothetical protein [Candidatus Thiodiazotropha sp. (ex Dulcina madagascariensis)]
MQETTLTGTVVIATAVVIFVLFLMLLVVVLDHKARIPGKLRSDFFGITGTRRDHPLWSYLIGSVVLLIISAIGIQFVASLASHLPVQESNKPSKLLKSLARKSASEEARHFHNPANSLALEGKKSVCYYCHGDFPHFQERMIRTLLNMHTQFLGCMTCHADPEKIEENAITLKWLNFSGMEVNGPLFGTDYDPETGFLIRTDDFYSKIVPYLNDDGAQRLLEITEDDPMAIDFVQVQEQLKGRDRATVKKSLHELVAPIGRFCTKCHTQEEESFIPFDKLGFSRERIYDLTNLNIIGLVQKYKQFYMPDIMERDVKPIDIDYPVAPEAEDPFMDLLKNKESNSVK